MWDGDCVVPGPTQEEVQGIVVGCLALDPGGGTWLEAGGGVLTGVWGNRELQSTEGAQTRAWLQDQHQGPLGARNWECLS